MVPATKSPQPLLLLVTEHRDHTDEIGRLGVHDAQQVPRERLEEGDLATGVLDNANLEQSLAGGLAVP